MILWLNGAFGVGKTTTSRAIRERAPTWRSFDPEQVGMLLQPTWLGSSSTTFGPATLALIGSGGGV